MKSKPIHNKYAKATYICFVKAKETIWKRDHDRIAN